MTATLERIAAHVARSAIRLENDTDRDAVSLRALANLDEAVRQSDIVVLGELNHFVHEKSDFRLLFCRYLLRLGFTTFAEELGWSDGVRVDRFLSDGDERELERLPSFGYTGHRRADRDDRPRGILKTAFDSYPTSLFIAEQSRFYRGLRGAAEGRPLRYFGFDIDGSPGGIYEDLLPLLTSIPENDPFRTALARVPGEPASEEALRLARATERIPEDLPEQDRLVISAALSAASDGLSYVAATGAATSYEALRPGMALREDAMKRRLAAIGEISGENAKLVLMGHALHLVKDDESLRTGAGSVGPGGGRTASLGHHLAQEQRKRICAIWFLYGAGEDSQPFPDLPRRAAFPAATLNAALSAIGAPLVFSTRDKVFDPPVAIGHMYNALVDVPLSKQADAVFFLPSVTPLRSC